MRKFVLASRVLLVATLSLAGSVCFADEEAETEAVDVPVLTIGSTAPALDVEHWVSDRNGEFQAVTEFEEGKIYVIEFWATWCGPCISSMPHLVELQNAHAKDGVQVISISDEDIDRVNKFLERKYTAGDEAVESEEQPANYAELTSAYCLTTDPDKSCKTDYMTAANQNGIPCCFLVGKTGKIEWIGHPMSLDRSLEAVIAGTWDRDKEYAITQKIDKAVAEAGAMLQEDDFDGAVALFEGLREEVSGDAADQVEFYIGRVRQIQMQQLVREGKSDEAIAMLDQQMAAAEEADKTALMQQKFGLLMTAKMEDEAAVLLDQLTAKLPAEDLNHVAWAVYQAAAKEDSEISEKLVEAATAAAKKAVEADPENAAILDTLAHLIHLSGDLQQAIKIQTKAVEMQDAENGSISEFLKQLQDEASAKDKADEAEDDKEKEDTEKTNDQS